MNNFENNIIRQRISLGFILFENIPFLYPKGKYVRTKDGEIGAKVTSTTRTEDEFGHEYFEINTEMIGSDGYSFNRIKKPYEIHHWNGVRKIDELVIIPLLEEEEIYNKLVARGRKFVKYAIGHHFLQYSTYKGGKCRVMVDIRSYLDLTKLILVSSGYQHSKDDGSEHCYRHYYGKDVEYDKKFNVREEELFMCGPALPAFDFAQKKWISIDVNILNEISFNEVAFERLVLNKTTKDLIEGLVTFKYDKTDLISGKGAGCSILLHGPPGVGKTLTAEAISEALHRPLYHISIGELGTDAENLESSLNRIFKMTHAWNAIILIDEADVFLERRSVHEIERNSLVCVFLRLLDYHKGIVFLTTNRVNCFDDAFRTRISIFLEYKELNAEARETLWRTFLNCDKNNSVEIAKIKDKRLNGREINNAVKLAMALANKRKQSISTELLEEIINLTEVNKRKLNQDDQPTSKKVR